MRIEAFPRKVQEGEKPLWKLEAAEHVGADLFQTREWLDAPYMVAMTDDELMAAVKGTRSHLLSAAYALALVQRMIAVDELSLMFGKGSPEPSK